MHNVKWFETREEHENFLTRKPAGRRLNRSGTELVNGPRALFPPKSLDDFGWLEPELKIVLSQNGVFPHKSIIVFCDDTMNRESDFLEPVVRVAKWDRSADMKADLLFPDVHLSLGHVQDWARTQWVAKSLQSAASTFGFRPSGLSRQRDVPDLDLDKPRLFFRVMLFNGAQRVEIASPAIVSDPFADEVANACENLIDELAEIDPAGWRERYDTDLTAEYVSSFWDRQL